MQGNCFYHGESMKGTFRPGDSLTMVPVTLDRIRPGDIVVYRKPDCQDDKDKVVHRVMKVVPMGLIMRGDNNPCTDITVVFEDDVLGRVTHVEREGRTRRVRDGRRGLWHARILRIRRTVARHMWRLVVRVGRRPYRWLRASDLVPRLWRPPITKVYLMTKKGPLVKYVCGQRTVAYWWPQLNHFRCRKPYDLFISRPDDLA